MLKTADLARKTILSDSLKRFMDLNTDFGQSRDAQFFENLDESLLKYVSSVNIPCCVHDGEPAGVLQAIRTAKAYNCAVGAHIGYPDPTGTGYEAVNLSPEELKAWVLYQVGGFRALLQLENLDIEHVRPHGALYGKFLTDEATAMAVAEALYQFSPWVILVGPAGPLLETVAKKVGIRTAPEVYLGKRYGTDGALVAQRFPENLSPQAALDQARQLIQENRLVTQEGKTVDVTYRTLHIGPNTPEAMKLAEGVIGLLGQAVPLSVSAVAETGWI